MAGPKNCEFKKFIPEDIPLFTEWMNDRRVKKHIFIDDVTAYYEQSLKENYRMYSVVCDGKIVAHLSGETENNAVSVCLIVAPELHNCGTGTEIIKKAISECRKLFGDVTEIYAYIYDSNPASIKCFEKAGFIKTESVGDGENIYIYRIKEDLS